MTCPSPRPTCFRGDTVATLRFLVGLTFTVLLTRPASATEPLRGYGEVGGELGFTSGPLSEGALPAAPGFRVEFGVGPRALPLTLGLGAGVLVLDRRTSSGPLALTATGDGLALQRDDTVESTELRHAAFVLRLEPDFRWVRPFATAELGFAALWRTRDDGSAGEEQQLDVTWTRGVSLGLDFDAWGVRRSRNGTGSVCLTLGVRAFETGAFLGEPTALSSTGNLAGSVRVVSPFLALTVAGWS